MATEHNVQRTYLGNGEVSEICKHFVFDSRGQLIGSFLILKGCEIPRFECSDFSKSIPYDL